MLLTDEQKTQIKEEVKATVSEAFAESMAEKSKEVPKRFSPKVEDPNIKITSDPNDRLIADPKGGYGGFGEFLKELVAVEDKTATKSPEKLSRWVTALKTAGTMEEGVQTQGG